MDELIKHVAEQRHYLALTKNHRDKLLQELEKMPLYQSYLEAQENIKTGKGLVEQAETDLKEAAVKRYEADQDKHPHAAVSIGEYDVLEYAPADALKYCISHDMPTLLNLNKSAFNKAAKTGIFEFVTIEKEPRARIATDLSEYLLQETTS